MALLPHQQQAIDMAQIPSRMHRLAQGAGKSALSTIHREIIAVDGEQVWVESKRVLHDAEMDGVRVQILAVTLWRGWDGRQERSMQLIVGFKHADKTTTYTTTRRLERRAKQTYAPGRAARAMAALAIIALKDLKP